MRQWHRRAVAAATLLSLFAVTPSEARWLRAESPQFIVYSEGSEASVRAATQELQDFDAPAPDGVYG
jgi:hypothetical protein